MTKTNSAALGNDERLKKSAGESARGNRDDADDARTNQDGTVMSSQERRRLLREEMVQEVLPKPPEMPGFHLCWLSTTNSTDPIYKRLQRGYQLVKQSEVPGFEQFRVTGGDFDGCVACNEMLLSKVPLELYQDIMMIYHHDMPLEQEQAIKERIESQSRKDSDGRQLNTVEGDFERLGQRPARAPTFV